jgi:hypothetical protein
MNSTGKNLGIRYLKKINAGLEKRKCKYDSLNGVIKRNFENKINTDILLRLCTVMHLNQRHSLAMKLGF